MVVGSALVELCEQANAPERIKALTASLAEAVYAADLGLDSTLGRACQHPGNVWSLHGYHECLTRLGKTDTARDDATQELRD